MARQREAEEEYSQLQSTIEQGRLAVEARKNDLTAIQRDLDLTLSEYRQQLADRVQVDLKRNEKETSLKQTVELKGRVEKANFLMTLQIQSANKSLQTNKEQLPPLKISIEKLMEKKQECAARLERTKEEMEQLKKGEDVYMSDILKAEAEEGSLQEVIEHVLRKNKCLLSEIESHRSIEEANTKAVSAISKQRDVAITSLSELKLLIRESEEALALKGKEVEDWRTLLKEKEKQRSDFQSLYDLMKNERNKFVHHIRIGRLGAAEMENELKTLQEEVDCQQEIHKAKLAELEAQRIKYQASLEDRESLKLELSQRRWELRDKQGMVVQETFSVENLMFIINQMEKEMIKSRQYLDLILHNRNFTGLLLIDRNDELCLLYERLHLQEEIQRQGELELKKSEDELRLLRIEAANVQRSIEAVRKLQKEIPEIDEEIAWLQCQLLDARKDVDSKSRELEDPKNADRRLDLDGTETDCDQLEAKLRNLQSSIESKQEQCCQRGLVLEEIAKVTDSLSADLESRSKTALRLGKDLVQLDRKKGELDRKIKSTVAELSVHRDIVAKSADERDRLREAAEEARRRFEIGEPLSDDIEQQWLQIQRQEETISRLQNEKRQLEDMLAPSMSPIDPRPRAYIPDDLGIPRPFHPGLFKPTSRGSTMRHIRKPKLPEIII